MKSLIFFLLSVAAVASAKPLSFTVTEFPYRFSTDFEMQGKDSYEGKVTKDAISVRTVYDLYDADGNYTAQGICRLLSLGSFTSWARTIDLYDADGNTIGLIEGRVMTTSKASYYLYDGVGTFLGTAYLNHDASGFLIQNPKEASLAILKRHSVVNATDHWDVTLHDDTKLDTRILKIFSAFAVDHQKYFKPDV